MFSNLKPFFARAAIPIAATITLWSIRLMRHDGSLAILLTAPEFNTFYYFEELAGYFVWCVFAVSWHRYVLLGLRDTTSSLQFYVSCREFSFFSTV